jgi:hypothetical protein
LSKLCLTVDNQPANQDIDTDGELNFATRIEDTGCWLTRYSIALAVFVIDGTNWANGPHTFSVSWTDNLNRTVVSDILTVNTFNYSPKLKLKSTSGLDVTGVFKVSAVARPHRFSTGKVLKWCLKLDNQPIKYDVQESFRDRFGLLESGTFDSESGCWTGRFTLAEATFAIDTSSWSNAGRTLNLTITDTAGRSDSTSLVFTTSNPQPSTQIVGLSENQMIRGSFSIQYRVVHPGAKKIDSWCFKIKDDVCQSGGGEDYSESKQTTSRSIDIDTSLWTNGRYVASVSATDSAGRSFSTGSINFLVSNPPARATRPVVNTLTPRWSAKTVAVKVKTTLSFATSATVRWGVTSKALTKSKRLSASGTQSITLKGLKPRSTYYVRVFTRGPNGPGMSKVARFITEPIPPRPRPNLASGGSGLSGGGGSFPSMVGLPLDVALSIGSFGYRQATYCGLGLEKGFLGILDKSNWQVVSQDGSMLYVCKFR